MGIVLDERVSKFFTKFMCLRNVSHKSAFRTGDNARGVQFEASFIHFCKVQMSSVGA